MPQLTPDFDRVIVLGFPPSDGTEFNMLYVVRLFQMMMEIRISEDYWFSDIYVFDFVHATPNHVSKMTPALLKKYETCCVVSSTYNFCLYKDNRA